MQSLSPEWWKPNLCFDFPSEVVRKNEAWVRAKVKDDPEMYNLDVGALTKIAIPTFLWDCISKGLGVGSWSWEK